MPLRSALKVRPRAAAAALPSTLRHPGFRGAAPTPPLRVELGQLGSGRTLPQGALGDLGQRLGHDFGAVRVHHDEPAAELAEGVGARAFAFGGHLVFAEGEYRPESAAGRELLAHELAHTVQQAPGGAIGRPAIQRNQRQVDWGPTADGFLQGLAAAVQTRLRGRLIAALRAESAITSSRPSDYRLAISRGVRVEEISTPAAASTARYEPISRKLQIGPNATADAIADTLHHATVDVFWDPTPAGPISALPAAQQQQVEAERTERDQILTDMFRDMSPQPAAGTVRGQLSGGGGTAIRINLREQTRISLRAFSIAQLRRLKDAGLRFWRRTQGLPPNYDVSPCNNQGTSQLCIRIPTSDPNFRRLPRSERGTTDALLNLPGGGIANYQPQIRTVYLNRPDNSVHWGQIRHELAHAWDDVRNDSRLTRLDRMSAAARRAFIRRVAVDRSRAQQLTAMRAGRSSAQDIRRELGAIGAPIFQSEAGGQGGVPQMFELYRRGLPSRQLAFDGSARQGHSLTSVREFYAEGFNVFHGQGRESQARLLLYAPELYGLLEREAQAEGRPVPSRAALQNHIRANQRYFPARRTPSPAP